MKDFSRIREIASILSRYGFDDVAGRLGFVASCRAVAYRLAGRREPPRLPEAVRVRMAVTDLGGTFVKLGQMLATRPDILPPEYITEFKKFQDDVPPFPFEQVREEFERETGRAIEDVFESLDENPVAAASIGQVHVGVLKSGEKVVLKVQRPGLSKKIAADLRLLMRMAAVLEKRVPVFSQMSAVALVEEFRQNLLREMDFLGEVNNMVRYAAMFKDDPGMFVPAPFREFCTRSVIVMEHVDGFKVTDRAALESAGIDISKVVEAGMRVILRSIFEFGFFHADPHPGNFFVLKDGTIALLDYGMVGTVDSRRIDEMAAFMISIANADVDMMVDVLIDMDVISDDTDVRVLRSDLASLISRYKGASLEDVEIATFMNEAITAARKHSVNLPTDLLMVGKSIAIMEGVGHEVCPDFKPIEYLKPYIQQIYMDRMLDSEKNTRSLTKAAIGAMGLLKDAPYDIRRILRRMRRGEHSMVIRSGDEKTRRIDLHVLVNRALLGFMFVAFFFGAALLVDSEFPVRRAFGLISGVLSAVLLICLVVSMLIHDGRPK